ncbi:uncharacterized protein CEXT_148191 [Caerostris extrusa]|uniref:Vitellogenin domain-containing protein n=1 Tax=Caerostris extrusa TaxID=172846 RepID=A0AAV4RRI9_CAEEX|nr:uncharacterized protein CEXT_148191 [Caerostris extrusa]
MEILQIFVTFTLIVTLALGQSDVPDPLKYDNKGLVTRINCEVREPQHFLYSSTTDLWGMMGGQIILSADVILLCMGDDNGGNYGPEALRYKVEIENLQIIEKSDGKMESIKEKEPQPEVTRASHDDPPPDLSPEEEPEDDVVMEDYLSLYSAPFQFIQLANGSIPEIRFSENEVDTRVKNFKRHIVDAFSTQLSFDQRKNKVVETSVIGEHSSNYNVSINVEKANLNSGGVSPLKQEKPTVVVKKIVTGDDVLRLAPSPAVNDRDKMDLKLEQVQIFQEGRMISSSGISSLTLPSNFRK